MYSAGVYYARHQHGSRRCVCVCASCEVFPHNWIARRHYTRVPHHAIPSFDARVQCIEATTVSARRPVPFILSHDKNASGCLVVARPAVRPAEWLDPPGRAYRIKMPTAHDLLPPAMWYSTLRNASETRWLDSDPRPTATPMDLDALAALLLHIEPQPPGKRRVYGRLTILFFHLRLLA